MVKTMLSCATPQEGMWRPQGGHFQDVCGELVFLTSQKILLQLSWHML